MDVVPAVFGSRRHSLNIAKRAAIAITVFDSTVEVGQAEAAYFDAHAERAGRDEGEIQAALRSLNAACRSTTPGAGPVVALTRPTRRGASRPLQAPQQASVRAGTGAAGAISSLCLGWPLRPFVRGPSSARSACSLLLHGGCAHEQTPDIRSLTALAPM